MAFLLKTLLLLCNNLLINPNVGTACCSESLADTCRTTGRCLF